MWRRCWGSTFEPCKPAVQGTVVRRTNQKERWSCGSYPARRQGSMQEMMTDHCHAHAAQMMIV